MLPNTTTSSRVVHGTALRGVVEPRRRIWSGFALLLLIASTQAGCIRFRNDAPSDAGHDTGEAPSDGGIDVADAPPPPVCDKFGPGVPELVAGDVITELVSSCSLRRHFANLPPIAITHLQECLAAQIGQVMGCRRLNGDFYRYPTTDSKGNFCRDMKSAHSGIASSDGDFDAFILAIDHALDKNDFAPDDKMRVEGVFGATRNDIVRMNLKEAGPTLPCDAPDAG